MHLYRILIFIKWNNFNFWKVFNIELLSNYVSDGQFRVKRTKMSDSSRRISVVSSNNLNPESNRVNPAISKAKKFDSRGDSLCVPRVTAAIPCLWRGANIVNRFPARANRTSKSELHVAAIDFTLCMTEETTHFNARNVKIH